MKDWKTMSQAEKDAVKFGSFQTRQQADSCLHDVLALLWGNEAATKVAWSLAYGCYAVNTPEEIVAYCREVAGC